MAKADSAKPSLSADTRVLILHGPERFLQDQYLKQLRDALAKVHGPDGVDTLRFDGSVGARVLPDVLDECRSFGLMQQHKIILIENADALVKAADDDAPAPAASSGGKAAKARRGYVPQSARELLENYCQSPSPNATLVLRANTWRPGNLDKAVEKVGAVLKCEEPSPAQATAWAQRRAQVRHQSSIDPEAAAMLVAAVGGDLGRIDSELAKLALAAGGRGEPITQALVRDMVNTTREEEFWAIQDALLSGKPARALAQLRDLVEISRHDPVPITYTYLETARKIHAAARGIAEQQPPARIAPWLRVFGFGPAKDQTVNAIFSAARAIGPGQSSGAAGLLAAAIATDAANKSGLGEPVRNLERLTMRFSPPARR